MGTDQSTRGGGESRYIMGSKSLPDYLAILPIAILLIHPLPALVGEYIYLLLRCFTNKFTLRIQLSRTLAKIPRGKQNIIYQSFM